MLDTSSSKCTESQLRLVHASLLTIRNMSRRMLLDDQFPGYLHKELVDIENLADLSESLIHHNDGEIIALLENKLQTI